MKNKQLENTCEKCGFVLSKFRPKASLATHMWRKHSSKSGTGNVAHKVTQNWEEEFDKQFGNWEWYSSVRDFIRTNFISKAALQETIEGMQGTHFEQFKHPNGWNRTKWYSKVEIDNKLDQVLELLK